MREHAVVAHRDRERFHAESRDEWQRWLAQPRHLRRRVAGVVEEEHRQAAGVQGCVEAALAYGWIDSTAGTLDDERSMLWFARRRPNSGWSRPNKERIARLEAAGLMAPPGKQAVEIAKENGSWTLLDDVWNLVVPDDLTPRWPSARALGSNGTRSRRRAEPSSSGSCRRSVRTPGASASRRPPMRPPAANAPTDLSAPRPLLRGVSECALRMTASMFGQLADACRPRPAVS